MAHCHNILCCIHCINIFFWIQLNVQISHLQPQNVALGKFVVSLMRGLKDCWFLARWVSSDTGIIKIGCIFVISTWPQGLGSAEPKELWLLLAKHDQCTHQGIEGSSSKDGEFRFRPNQHHRTALRRLPTISSPSTTNCFPCNLTLSNPLSHSLYCCSFQKDGEYSSSDCPWFDRYANHQSLVSAGELSGTAFLSSEWMWHGKLTRVRLLQCMPMLTLLFV